jgi:hypothetical protein
MLTKESYTCFNCSGIFEVDMDNDNKIYNLCKSCNIGYNMYNTKVVASGKPYNWGSGFVEGVIGTGSNASSSDKLVFVKPSHDRYHINTLDINSKPGFINWIVSKPSEIRLISDEEEQLFLKNRQEKCSNILETFQQLNMNDFLIKDYNCKKSNLSTVLKKLNINITNINLETVKHYKYRYQENLYLIISFNINSLMYYTVSTVSFEYWMECNWLGFRMYKKHNSNKFKCII